MSLVLGLLFNSSTFLPHCRIFFSFSLSWLWSAALSFLCLSLFSVHLCAFVCLSPEWHFLTEDFCLLACLLYATVFVPFLSFFQSLSAQSRFIERLAKAAAADVLRALLKSVTGAQTLRVKMKRKKNSHRIWTTADAGAEFVLMGK